MAVMKIPFQKVDGAYQMRELFVYPTNRCDKACGHCFMSSGPNNRTLDDMTYEDLAPFLREAKHFGVRDVNFTGGEASLVPDFLRMVGEAALFADVVVFTNGSKVIRSKLDRLAELTQSSSLLLRFSFDHYDPDVHDREYQRGVRPKTGQEYLAFAESLETAVMAANTGIAIAVTTQEDHVYGGNPHYIDTHFRELFAQRGVELTDVKVLPKIPQGFHADKLIQIGQAPKHTPISPAEYEMSGTKHGHLMCHVGRTVAKWGGEMHVLPCAVLVPGRAVDIDVLGRYDMGRTLAASFEVEQPLDHESCRRYCVTGKQTCGK